MSTQIATVGNWTLEDVKTMKETLAVGTTDSQFQLFLRTAHASGLNPFLNHIYAITYQGKMSLQIGIEGIAFLAKQKDGYQGYDVQVVYEGEEFKAKRLKEGEWEISHEMDGFPTSDAKIKGAYAVAYREGFKPYTVVMSFGEVEHFFTSSIANQQTMWKKYTADMFKKHVLKRALKGQFGIDINEDEVLANHTESYEPPSRKDISTEASHSNTTAPEKATAKKPELTDKEVKEQLKAQISEKLEALGMDTKEAKGAYLAENAKFADPKNPTIEERKQLLKIMDMHLAEKQAADDDDLPLT